MTESIQLGIFGLSVPPGTHLCGFFRGRKERGDIVFPFVREALRSGDKCLCAYEGTDRDALHAEVSAEVQVASVSDQLDIVPSRDIYLGRGAFSAANMIDYWDTWAATALAGGKYSSARAVGEMTLAVTEVIGTANLLSYESELNRFVTRYPQVLLCLYDLDPFRADLFIDIMRTHPKVLMGSTVLDNPYYTEPDELVASHR